MPKRGDVVLYIQGEKTYNALVLQEAAANDARLGKAGEPSLHLAVVLDDLPRAKPRPIGELPEPTTIHDVVHFSQQFNVDYQREYGPSFASHRGAGEWREFARIVKGVKP